MPGHEHRAGVRESAAPGLHGRPVRGRSQPGAAARSTWSCLSSARRTPAGATAPRSGSLSARPGVPVMHWHDVAALCLPVLRRWLAQARHGRSAGSSGARTWGTLRAALGLPPCGRGARPAHSCRYSPPCRSSLPGQLRRRVPLRLRIAPRLQPGQRIAPARADRIERQPATRHRAPAGTGRAGLAARLSWTALRHPCRRPHPPAPCARAPGCRQRCLRGDRWRTHRADGDATGRSLGSAGAVGHGIAGALAARGHSWWGKRLH